MPFGRTLFDEGLRLGRAIGLLPEDFPTWAPFKASAKGDPLAVRSPHWKLERDDGAARKLRACVALQVVDPERVIRGNRREAPSVRRKPGVPGVQPCFQRKGRDRAGSINADKRRQLASAVAHVARRVDEGPRVGHREGSRETRRNGNVLESSDGGARLLRAQGVEGHREEGAQRVQVQEMPRRDVTPRERGREEVPELAVSKVQDSDVSPPRGVLVRDQEAASGQVLGPENASGTVLTFDFDRSGGRCRSSARRRNCPYPSLLQTNERNGAVLAPVSSEIIRDPADRLRQAGGQREFLELANTRPHRGRVGGEGDPVSIRREEGTFGGFAVRHELRLASVEMVDIELLEAAFLRGDVGE